MSLSFREMERQLWGKASEAGTTDQGPPPGPSPFRQPMQWIKGALGLQSGEPPQALNTTQIISAMDVMQGGWPFAIYSSTGLAVAGPVGGAWRINLTDADSTALHVILTLAIRNQSAATTYAGVYRLSTMAATAGGGSGIQVIGIPAQGALAPATLADLGAAEAVVANWSVAPAASWDSTVGILGARPLIVPAGMVLVANSANLLAGDTLEFHTTWAKIPNGFKP